MTCSRESLTGQIDGELVSLEVGVNLASTIFLGGLDTLPSNIGWTLRFLADNPAHRQRIINDPSCIPPPSRSSSGGSRP